MQFFGQKVVNNIDDIVKLTVQSINFSAYVRIHIYIYIYIYIYTNVG